MKQAFLNRTHVSRFVSVTAAVLLAVSPISPLYADQYDAQINQLKTEVKNLNGTATDLKIQGDTLQQTVNSLKAQIASLQKKIASNQQKKDKLQVEIAQAKLDIEERNKALGDNLRMMYLEGEVSSLEKVASSKSISEFVDKQEYRNKIQEKVKTAQQEIKQLKEKLEQQKTEVERLIKDAEAMKAEVAAQKAAQAKLLAQTRGKESEYQKQIAGHRAQIGELERQQAAENARLSSGQNYYIGGTGSYPWANQGFPCSGADPWGMCYRQCVSYTAWKVASTGHYMPYWGNVSANATNWPGLARGEGIPTGSEPRANSVAIAHIGTYGHAMWVEAVLPGGMIKISQYNRDFDGRFSTDVISSGGMEYIYFQ